MEKRGSRLRIHLIMGAENLNMTLSRNTVAEVTGSTYPEQVNFVRSISNREAAREHVTSGIAKFQDGGRFKNSTEVPNTV